MICLQQSEKEKKKWHALNSAAILTVLEPVEL